MENLRTSSYLIPVKLDSEGCLFHCLAIICETKTGETTLAGCWYRSYRLDRNILSN